MAHHAFDIDTPGRRLIRAQRAAAAEVVISSTKRWAVMHENQSQAEPTLDELLARMSPADIVLVEAHSKTTHTQKLRSIAHRPAQN